MDNLDQKEKEAIQEMTKKMYEGMDESLIEKALQNNELEFDFGDTKYRVRKPTFSEKQSLEKVRLKKFNEFLLDADYMLQEKLVELLKAKGVDIEKFDDQIRKLESEKQNLQLKLAKGLIDKIADNELEEFRKHIQDIIEVQRNLIIRKNMYLEFSIENQLTVHMYLYLTTIITEKKVGDEWVKVWKNMDEFSKCDDGNLVKQATFCTTLVARDEVEA